MIKDIKNTVVYIGDVLRQKLEDTLKAWMEWTCYGGTKEEPEVSRGCGGTSQYTTYVIGPCVTRVYTGQKMDI